MMAPQILQGLQRLFDNEGARVVLWHDPAGEFTGILDDLALDGVELLRLDQIGALEAKIQIEFSTSPKRFLVYAPFEVPDPEQDWLLDIRLYGKSFRADPASILLDELGLAKQSMRAHLVARQKFLNAKERVGRLKKWVSPQDTESELDLKMLAVVARADQPEPFAILTRLYVAMAAEPAADIFQPGKTWQDMCGFDLETPFWDLMARTFGYAEDNRSLTDLLFRLLVTDFSLVVRAALPQSLKHFLLPSRSLARNAAVFLGQWRSNVTAATAYDTLSRRVAKELKMEEHIDSLGMDVLGEAMTFEDIEKAVLRDLRDRVVTHPQGLKLAEIRDVIQRRRDGHWTSPVRRPDGSNAFRAGYDAIEAAAEMMVMKADLGESFTYATAADAVESYLSRLYRLDQLYRLFHEAADTVELAGWDVLKTLQEAVESTYSGWFMPHLASAWGPLFEGEEGLLKKWGVDGLDNQYRFFARHVRPVLDQSPRGKVYVLISDAFRYEAAEELTRELSGRYRFKAALSAMLGVLPSYTTLGMAALLPHKTLAYKSNLDVLVDGKPSAGLEQRAKLLADYDGVAVKAEELLAMNKDQGREFVKPWRVIYVYHNQVDAVGDTASTETKTFDAVRTAITELASMVRFIINSLNGSTVFVTADHGFLYQDSPLEAFDKSSLAEKPAGTLRAKKRYLLGNALGKNAKAWCSDTATTAVMEPSMEFWVPKGVNRFHFAGGARFVHGGAMPQEILVPLIMVRELEGRAAESTAIRKVDVTLLGSTRKIVNNVQRFEFIQNDAVSERVQSRTVLISLRDDNEPISNEVTLTFGSQSDKLDERKQAAQLTLKAGQYEKSRNYALLIIDVESKIEVARIAFTIDLAFSNDF